jgi:DNA anti-recombination protein RmuC
MASQLTAVAEAAGVNIGAGDRVARQARAVIDAYADVASTIGKLKISYDSLGASANKLGAAQSKAAKGVDELTKSLQEQQKALNLQKDMFDSALRAIIKL